MVYEAALVIKSLANAESLDGLRPSCQTLSPMSQVQRLLRDLVGLPGLAYRSYPRLTILVAYILIAVAAASPIAFGDKTLGPEHAMEVDGFYGRGRPAARFYGDETPVLLDYPRDMMIARSLRSGRPFSWNPLVAAGVPLLAEQSGAFFPLRVLFYLFPGPASYTLFRMSRMILAALGAFALARSRGRSPWASFVAGGLFELCGPMIWMLPFAGTSSAFVAPWFVLGVNLLFQERARLAVAVTGGAIGLILLGGHPGIAAAALLTGVAAFLGATVENVRTPDKIARAMGRAATAGLLGLAIAACTILPFAELLSLGHSYKGTGMGRGIWLANISLSRRFWWQGAFSPTLVDKLREASGRYPYTLTAVYGLLTLYLALVASLRRRIDCRLGFVALFGVVLTFLPPGFAWMASFPGFQNLLAPYCSVMIALPLTQWAASGIDRLPRIQSRIIFRSAQSDGGHRYEISGRVATALFALVMLMTAAKLSFDLLNPLRDTVVNAFSPITVRGVGFPYLFVLVTIGVAVALLRHRPSATGVLLGAAALLELIVIDIPHFNEPVSVSVRQGRPSGVTEVERIVTSSHARVASNGSLACPQYNLLEGIRDLRIVSALVPDRYHDYMSMLNSGFFTVYQPAKTESPLLDIAAVRFFILSDSGAPSPRRATAGPGWGLFVNEQAAARARLVHAVEIVDGEPQALSWLGGAVGAATHMSQTVLAYQAVVETGGAPSPLKRELLELKGTPLTEPGTAVFVDDRPDHVSIAVETKAPGLLVLADTTYPGWRAQIDGVSTAILPTNVLFRGVLVGSGKHLVKFDYRPFSLWLGLILSLLGSGAVTVLLVGEMRKRRAATTNGTA